MALWLGKHYKYIVWSPARKQGQSVTFGVHAGSERIGVGAVSEWMGERGHWWQQSSSPLP